MQELRSAYAEHIQSITQSNGLLVSTNGRHQITVSEVQDHFMIPEYPDTSEDGILHFIHTQSAFDSNDKKSIEKMVAEHMSKVCST